MKKALHNEKEPFLLHKKGELIGWGINDVKNLIEAANAAVINEETKSRKLTYDEHFKIIIHDWFEIFVNEGITEKVIKHLNARIQHVRFHHVLKYSEYGFPYWRYIADSHSVMSDPELQSAYGITHLLAIGALKDLKRCGQMDCQKFFIGRSNVRWCSKSCGSLYRVRLKRKRDKP